MPFRTFLLAGVAVLSFAQLLVAKPVSVTFSGFAAEHGTPAGWTTWAPRAEIAPRAYIDPDVSRNGPGSLAIAGNGNAAAFGGWEYVVRGLEPGQWYHFAAWYRARGLTNEPVQVLAELIWITDRNADAAPPDFPYQATPDAGWTKLSLDVPAPPRARAVRLRLLLANAPNATVWWNDLSFVEIPRPAPRPVTIAAIKFQPKDTQSSDDALRRCVEAIDSNVKVKADVILLGEAITWNTARETMVQAGEPIPGPSTMRLGEVARARKAYVVAGLVEREGAAVYNTAVLIDREGRLAGKYRKVHLPYTEISWGITPGDRYPVFETDFGRIGIMTCWDSQFAGPARALAMGGAEIIFLPVWAGTEILVKARAIDNQVFLATSSYADPSVILDPNGEAQAIATDQGSAAIATIDLARRYLRPVRMDNMRERLVREMRLGPEAEVRRPGYVQ